MKQSLKQSKSRWARLSVVAACAVLFVLGSAAAGFAQQTTSPKPAASAAVSAPAAAPAVPKPVAETEETAKPAKPGGEGIKIHGHWKIVVKNPDGTVASSTEFENSLVTPGGGDAVLAGLLSGQLTWGGMSIDIEGNNMCSALCLLVPGSTVGTPTTPVNLAQFNVCGNTPCFPGLTITANPANSTVTPPTGASLTLQGSFTETTSESLVSVGTIFFGCLSSSASTVSASACSNYNGYNAFPNGVANSEGSFTGRNGLSVSAVPGQVVTIVVTISFS
jgi:hypothetical protein